MQLCFELEGAKFGSKQGTARESDEAKSEAWIWFAAFPPPSQFFETSAGDRIGRQEDVPFTGDSLNVIKASVYVTRSTTESGRSSIRYSDSGTHGTAEIYISVYLSPAAFDELRADLRAGLGPTLLAIDLDSDFRTGPIKYGTSRTVWDVGSSENRILPIREISFTYAKSEAVPSTNDDFDYTKRLRDEREMDIQQRLAIIHALKGLRQGINVLALLVILLCLVLWFR